MKYSRGYRRLLKCSHCGNVGYCLYLGSRDLNEGGEVSDIVGGLSLWVSYFLCPACGKVDVEFHPPGEEPDVAAKHFKEIGDEE